MSMQVLYKFEALHRAKFGECTFTGIAHVHWVTKISSGAYFVKISAAMHLVAWKELFVVRQRPVFAVNGSQQDVTRSMAKLLIRWFLPMGIITCTGMFLRSVLWGTYKQFFFPQPTPSTCGDSSCSCRFVLIKWMVWITQSPAFCAGNKVDDAWQCIKKHPYLEPFLNFSGSDTGVPPLFKLFWNSQTSGKVHRIVSLI